MSIRTRGGMRFVFVGNSITKRGWFSATESTDSGTDLLMQQIAPSNTSLNVNSFQGTNISMATARAQPARGLTAINSGVNGDTIADIEADIAGRITNFAPDVVVIEVGINDATAIPDPTPVEDFRASYDNVLETVQEALPDVQIVCVGMLCDGELWAESPSPHFAGNPSDAAIDLLEAQIQESAEAHGAYYIDVRTAGAVAESVLNTPAPGVNTGILTVDESRPEGGVHPNATGQRLMSDEASAAFS